MRLFGILLELILIGGFVLGFLAIARRLLAPTSMSERQNLNAGLPPEKGHRENQPPEVFTNEEPAQESPSNGDSLDNARELAAIARRRIEILAKMAADAKEK